jgi:hypothetical protein
MAQDHPTEAACLLEQGATYRRRIGLRRLDRSADPIFAGFKPGAFSLYFGDAPIYHFDLEGRWQRAFVDDAHYLKGLDATCQKLDRLREGTNLVLKRATLSGSQTAHFDEQVRAMALDLVAGLDAKRLGRVEPAAPKARPLNLDELREFLDRIARWDTAAWFSQRERYATICPTPSFLPPECQNAVVVQATRGPALGVGFGGAPGEAAQVHAPAEFERHARDVAALWGRRLLQSRTVFLAGGDILHRPVAEITALLSVISRTFPIEPRIERVANGQAAERDQPRFDGVHMFMHNFASPRLDRPGWSELTAGGLVRISLGVESGDPSIRTLYQKSWADEEIRATVAEIRATGIGISFLTLAGAGGTERARAHVDSTARLLESLDLAPGDFVFLLDEREIGDPVKSSVGSVPLQGTAWLEQQTNMKTALAPLKKRGVKVLPYTMEKQWT